MKRLLAITIGGVWLLSAGFAFAQASFGGDDPGCVPDSKDHLKCSDGALKAFIKAYQAAIKCHTKQADATQKGAPADDEACETSGGGKSAKEKLDAALGKLATLCSGTSVLANVATLEATLFAPKTTSGSADQQMGDIWCAGAQAIDGAGDDAGTVDTTSKDSEKCADGVAKNLSKLLGAVGKCHVKQADSVFGNKTFDEEACEEHDPIKGKAAHDKYTAADAKLVCPQSCLGGTQRAALGTNYIALLESMNDKFYPCAGPPTCAPIVIGQAIPHTYKLQGEAGNVSNKRCTTNSASNRFGPCNADTDCGGTAGACMQLPWVTADGQIMPFSNGTQTTFTVNTADSFPTCEHALCIPCGNANHIPCAGIPGCEVAGNPNGCNPRATQGCCDQAAFVVPTFFVNILGGLCSRVDQIGCGGGVVNTSSPQTGHNKVAKVGDTTDPGADCCYNGQPGSQCLGGVNLNDDPAPLACTTAGAGNDYAGKIVKTIGGGAADAPGIHFRYTVPELSTTWTDSQSPSGTCANGSTYDDGELLVSQLLLKADTTTSGASGSFQDSSGDNGKCAGGHCQQGGAVCTTDAQCTGPAGGCSRAGAGFISATNPLTDGPITVPGAESGGPARPQAYDGSTGSIAAAVSVVFSGPNSPIRDIGFVAITPQQAAILAPATSCSCTVQPGCPE